MKSILIYYSVTGNTESVARIICEKYGVDKVKINDKQRTSNNILLTAARVAVGMAGGNGKKQV